MAPPEPSDWELINAYADGELSPEDRKAFERRLAADTAVAAALEQVNSLKATMQHMKPAVGPRKPATGRLRHWVGPVPLAAAAAAAAAAIFGIAQLMPLSKSVTWDEFAANLHSKFSGNAYVLAPAKPILAISTGRMGDLAALDLSDSRLTLVDVWNVQVSGASVVAMHYRGPSGCSLTITVASETALRHPSAAPESDDLEAHWTAGGNHFHVVASGMDRSRFEAIAAFARAESLRQGGGEEMRMALRSATDRARPCA